MSIEVLSPEVVNQIAAGEVVERPAHLVKELIENSLDAGATEITVDYSQGGRYVKVLDNGCGILPADLPKVFLRFATSKIKEVDDIWQLSSFGFRGEALASISSVSKVTLFSSVESSGLGQRITCSYGQISPLEPVARTKGSTIIIEDLFQNVPARLKFMKGDAAESSQIKIVLKALALANPEVEFRVLQEGNLIFYWPRSTLAQRIENVLDIKPLYEGVAQRGNIKAHSFFTDPHQVSRVSKNIWFFAQKRFIQDRSLQAAVMEAYRNLLMHGEYPYVVSFIETDPSEVDVNIHPTKSQVKFAKPQDAFRAVQASIRDVLEKAPWLQNNSHHSGGGIEYRDQSQQSISSVFQTEELRTEKNKIAYNLQFEDEAFNRIQFRTKSEYSVENKDKNLEFKVEKIDFTENKESESRSSDAFTSEPRELLNNLETRYQAKAQVSNEIKASSVEYKKNTPLIRHWSLLQVIGQANLTYVVCQSDKGLIMIDQHAAHERIAFERLMNQWRGGQIEVQQFLFPLSIDLNEEKLEALMRRKEDFSKLGIELEELGPITVGVKSAPALIKERVLADEIQRFSTEVMDWGDSNPMEKAITDIAARMACHSVLRAGQSLSRPEMERLLEEMDEFPMSSFCPHGRPVSVVYSWSELEKDFGRRV